MKAIKRHTSNGDFCYLYPATAAEKEEIKDLTGKSSKDGYVFVAGDYKSAMRQAISDILK